MVEPRRYPSYCIDMGCNAALPVREELFSLSRSPKLGARKSLAGQKFDLSFFDEMADHAYARIGGIAKIDVIIIANPGGQMDIANHFPFVL